TDEVLLATELGVWSTDNVNTGSPIWGATSTGLANVRCDMLQYRDSDGQVLVATHGRGVYTGNPFSASTGGDTQPPTAPTNLSASGISASGFSISWDASSDNIGVTGYNVYVDGVLDGTTSLVSYSISGLSASTAYDVEVEATDAAGNLSTRVNVNVVTSSLGLTCFATASAFPYSESFESGVGSWQQGAGDDGDWVNYSGSTPSSNTGPSSASDGSFYMYLEASTNGTAGQIGANATAILDGPCFELSAETAATFSFSYHAYGSNVGSLSLEASTDGTSYTSLFDVAGNQGNSWQSVNVDLSSYLGSAVKLRLVGATGNGWSSDIAIDDLRLSTSGSGGSTISCTNTVTSFPYNQGFESGVGSWVQVSGDDGDWVNFIGSTPSSSTGPSGAFEGSLYMYLEASTNGTAGQIGNNATAILESPCLDLTSLSSGFFNFRYHMLGSNMGSLSLEASTDGSTWTSLWSQSGNQGNSWLSASISLSAYIGNVIKIRIVGVTGPGWQSDLAIDAIAVSTSAATPALETVSNPGVSKTPVEFGVEIFPNPVRDHLNIHIRGYDHVDYTLMAISGKMLRSGTLLQSERLDISELKTGYYLLHMQTLETNESIKFLKQ
ncbi:MAG: T9SS type A sorting domain-containing protein, partial [Cyclobacteriaceae bacterium]|nr:T9SS type A sorting domain-containing protein [Cyclobacteriaceae bacterium HetDA_MAG_MS6]